MRPGLKVIQRQFDSWIQNINLLRIMINYLKKCFQSNHEILNHHLIHWVDKYQENYNIIKVLTW